MVTAWAVWTPETGGIGDLVGFDTETDSIADPATVPRLVLASACSDRRGAFLVAAQDVVRFLEAHRQAGLVLHYGAFDREVVLHATGIDLCDWAEQGRLFDTGVLYRLVKLAEDGQVPPKWSLAAAAETVLARPLEKDDGVRCGFGQYLRPDGSVDLASLPEEAAAYAVDDSLATLDLWGELARKAEALAIEHGADPGLRLSHDLQLKAEIALSGVSRNGMAVDTGRAERVAAATEADIQRHEAVLREGYGYWGGKGEQARYGEAIARVERETGLAVPRTEKARLPSRRAADLAGVSGHPFVREFLQVQELRKLSSTYLRALRGRNHVHPSFVTLVNTGRTACRSPNLQNLPRDSDIRGLLVPSPGHLLLSADYAGIEHCALAQITYLRYGRSAMRDVLNSGVDLHRAFAASLTGKDPADVSDEERRKAKAAGFGFPGGLGTQSFRDYAARSYGLSLTEAEAGELRRAWFKMFPEMEQYMHDTTRVADRLFGDDAGVPVDWPREMVVGAALRVAAGSPFAGETGNPYPEAFIEWVWRRLGEVDFPGRQAFAADLLVQHGTDGLRDVLQCETVVWPSGRVRTGCRYTEARNAPFQGLAADGAKLALYRLGREGFRVVNFVHDEVLIELPEASDHLSLARRVEAIMVEEMRRVMPDVGVSVKYALMRRWHKDAKAVYDDPSNPERLLVWEPAADCGRPQATSHIYVDGKTAHE